jgi:hypothetical protein
MRGRVLYTYYLLLIFLCSSCAPSPSVVQTAIAQTNEFEFSIQTAIAQTQAFGSYNEQTALTPEPTITLPADYTKEPTMQEAPSATSTKKPNAVSIGQVVHIKNFCVFKVVDIYFSEKILPPNTSGYYRYYDSKSPNSTLLDVVIEIENLGSKIRSAESFVSVTALYDNNYTYSSSPVLVGPDGDFVLGFFGIEPLLTGEVHHIITVPNQVSNTSKPLAIIFKVENNEYHLQYR